MGMQLAVEMMKDYPPSIAATKKYGRLPEGFAWFAFEWLQNSDVMKITGGIARPAKSGPNKGTLILEKAKETKVTTYVTAAEIEQAREAIAKDQQP